jgi:hypothetical protein
MLTVIGHTVTNTSACPETDLTETVTAVPGGVRDTTPPEVKLNARSVPEAPARGLTPARQSRLMTGWSVSNRGLEVGP